MGINGITVPKHLYLAIRPPKASSLSQTASFEPLRMRIGSLVRGSPKNGVNKNRIHECAERPPANEFQPNLFNFEISIDSVAKFIVDH